MKEKTLQICVRVNENEKKKLQRNAKKCGLSLSTYLRKTGLKQQIYSIPDKDFYKIYVEICKVKDNLYKLNKEQIIKCFDIIEEHFLEIYNNKNGGGNEDGNDKNMGS